MTKQEAEKIAIVLTYISKWMIDELGVNLREVRRHGMPKGN